MNIRLVKGHEEIGRLDHECLRLDSERRKAVERAEKAERERDEAKRDAKSLRETYDYALNAWLEISRQFTGPVGKDSAQHVIDEIAKLRANNDALRAALSGLEKEASDFHAHTVDLGWVSADDDSDGIALLNAAIDAARAALRNNTT